MTPRFDESQRRFILSLAREAISVYLEFGKEVSFPAHDFLIAPGAAFVTLKIEEELRGCIGSTEARGSLGETIVRCAISAAFRDPRFLPLSRQELDLIRLEASILSPLTHIPAIEGIEVGIHGLTITLGAFHGLLLPQVAVEHDWDRETFLGFTCQKAGLPPDAWKLPDVKIQIFTAEVFGE